MHANIIVDPWKAPIFKKMLEAAGYNFTVCTTPAKAVVMLLVEAQDLGKLAAARSKLN